MLQGFAPTPLDYCTEGVQEEGGPRQSYESCCFLVKGHYSAGVLYVGQVIQTNKHTDGQTFSYSSEEASQTCSSPSSCKNVMVCEGGMEKER